MLKFTRDYFSKMPNINNETIPRLAIQSDELSYRQISKGYIAPQTFIYCDKEGLLQDMNNIPILYYWRKNKPNKRIAFNHSDYINRRERFKYSTYVPNNDYLDFHRLNFKKILVVK